MVKHLCIAAGLFVITAGNSTAQTTPQFNDRAAPPPPVEMPDIVTDRPDFTESSEIVPKGGFQFESGISFEGDDVDGVSSRGVGAPSALLRIGLGGRTELRLGGEGFISEAVQGVRASGYSDFEMGAKVRLFNQDQIGFDLALLPIVSLPTGADGFTSGGVDPTVKVTWARELAAGFGLTGNVNFSSLTDEEGRFHQEAVSLSLGHDLFAGWGGYFEAYGFSRLERGAGRAITINGGFARPVGDRLQFDIEAGRGVTSAAPDWFIGAGFAIRGPLGKR
jgi:hypothetical protein